MTRIGILIFPDVEVLDFCGPFEVFSVTRLKEPRERTDPCPFEVKLVAETLSPVTTTGGMRVLPDWDFATCPPLDVLVVPGGWGTRDQVNNPAVVDWVKGKAVGAKWVTSVCTGSFLLAQAGVLYRKPATTHWRSLDRMATTYPDVSVDREKQVVECGNVLTSAGISAGIDLALLLVAKLLGEPVARGTAKHMEYPYPDGIHRRVPV